MEAMAGFVRARLDVDTAPKADVDRFKVDSIPLVVVLAPDGKELGRSEGFRAPAEFLEFLAKLPKK
jgi:hypothetical protein